MIVSFLIAIIGIIPMVLAICVIKIYKGSELAYALLAYMLTITLWQLDVAVLYLEGVASKEVITWLFRIFRMGPTFMIPIVFYLAFILMEKHSTNIKNKTSYRFLISLFNRKVLWFLIIWSTVIYVMNMTGFGIEGVHKLEVYRMGSPYYFPVYGPLHILYIIHTFSFLVFVIFTYIISRQIENMYLKDFLSTFSLCTLLLFISGYLNFLPGTGALVSSIGVIIFSVIIVFSFVRMHTMLTVNYNRLMERQKKLDNAGSITASLVHEVKNTMQIINGYSKLLMEVSNLPAEGRKYTAMIDGSSKQLNELVIDYTKYLKYKSVEFKMVDINEIMEEAIGLSEEITRQNKIEVIFERQYQTLKTYANETYLKQVFLNLIKNAAEAFPEERSVRRIVISTTIKTDIISINFCDTGKGIERCYWESIFEPFQSTKKEGLGLGLPFVKNIILEHRGEIKVIDSTSEGTHMQILLPQYSFSTLE